MHNLINKTIALPVRDFQVYVNLQQEAEVLEKNKISTMLTTPTPDKYQDFEF